MIGSIKSIEFTPTSGIPQGSILGPLLFLIFINNLPSIFKSSYSSLFADDHKLAKKINNIDDCEALQADFFAGKNRLLEINSKKSHILTTTYKPRKIDYTYKMNGKEIKRVTVKKDLGVDFDEKVKFKYHLQKVLPNDWIYFSDY